MKIVKKILHISSVFPPSMTKEPEHHSNHPQSLVLLKKVLLIFISRHLTNQSNMFSVSPSVDKAVIAAFAKAPLKVKVGQTCRINIPMKGGNPPPTVTWEKNGKPVEGFQLVF